MGPWRGFTWNTALYLYEVVVMGRHRWWWRMNRLLRREYGRQDPDRWVRRLRGRSPGSLAYGETPAVCVRRVLQLLDLPAGARFVDLGSGRGVPCLTAAALGYPAAGLEYFAEHVERANRVAAALAVPATFTQGDLAEYPWPDGEVYFLAATAFPEGFRRRLEERLLALPEGTHVITHDWLLGEGFERQSSVVLPVSWGTAHYCLHRRCSVSCPE